ncbi:TnsA endonuclease N-terminal domain-containing protein [Hydrogenophaga crocea]|uniref:TnsA endonuclease N-terminal domain-containing protein n=1 Tax=Hydrogenophaga crocea TaxID=2716225 RepID=A0A6G8II12_9BURK|nr:TnsA endonuclease N-terminal domain-containing protein [Hydrogenophaga crocea]QIM52739.1 hypothetical protein G9Q37_11575 [Hydrogenophaga crocea]
MARSARKVVTRSPARSVRLINLPHLQSEAIEAESSVERDFAHLAALYPFTRRILHQPFRLDLDDRKYTPDFLVEFDDRSSIVIEVKVESKLERFESVYQAAKAKLAAHGVCLKIAHDQMIRTEGRAERALLIRRYSKDHCNEGEAQAILGLAQESQTGVRMSELLSRGFALPTIYHLIARRRMCTDSALDISRGAVLASINNLITEGRHADHFDRWLDA